MSESMTIEQAARMMNVSVRNVYKARELAATGRADLVEQVKAGKMSLHAALKAAKPSKHRTPNGCDRLMTAWHSATEDERAWFVANLQICSPVAERGMGVAS